MLYVVRGESEELRYSLRALERNASNLGRVVVAGTALPSWLSDEAVRVDVPSPFDRKQKNIMFAVLSAMRAGALPRPALYSSDDHYHVAPVDLDAYPWFVRADGYPPNGDNAYRMSIMTTGDMLRRNCLPCARRYDGHWNTHVDVADLPAVERFVAGYERTLYGYEPTTAFVAAAVARGAAPSLTVRRDVKFKADAEDYAAEAQKAGGVLSATKLAKVPRFRAWLESQFPEPSRWEKKE